MEYKENKEEEIKLRIEESRKEKWEAYFNSIGLSLSAGIRASVEKFMRDSSGKLENADTESKIDQLISQISKFEQLILEKEQKIKEMDYDMPENLEIENYEEIKKNVLNKLALYGCLSITYLSQLLYVSGPSLLIVLKRIKKEGEITINKDYEWCLK